MDEYKKSGVKPTDGTDGAKGTGGVAPDRVDLGLEIANGPGARYLPVPMDTPKRHYEDKTPDKGRLRDVDAADRAYRLKALAWSLPGGFVGWIVGDKLFGPPFGPVGFAVGYGFVFGVTALLVRSGAAAMGQIYHPSGKSTPVVREYSHGQSLAARGLYREAIDAYQADCAEFPDDPEPYLRIARLYLKELKQYEDAAAWFKKARGARGIDAGRDLVATQEIVDIYVHKLKQPRRAMPELARLAERFPGTPAGTWAQDQLRLRRESMAAEIRQEGGNAELRGD
jgi:tetratricopeptide (TPR) repeat protein